MKLTGTNDFFRLRQVLDKGGIALKTSKEMQADVQTLHDDNPLKSLDYSAHPYWIDYVKRDGSVITGYDSMDDIVMIEDWVHFDMLQALYGDFEYNGKELALLHQPEIEHDSYRASYNHGDGSIYQAQAIDQEGNEYQLTFIPYDEYEDMEDGADHCDWTIYTVTEL